MSPEELVNLSLHYEVEIEAHTTIHPKDLLTFSFRGCAPLKISRVPLYVALHLRSLNLCTIRTLYCLTKDFLSSLIEKEKSEANFVELPDCLFELGHFFSNHEVESSLCELKRIRRIKIWKGLKNLDGKAICINGMTKWEFNELKDFIIDSMEFGKRIETDE